MPASRAYVQSIDITVVVRWLWVMGSPGIWGHVAVVAQLVWAVGSGQGAHLPTEIRLISQELPKNGAMHLLCCRDGRVHALGTARASW